jgi:cyanate permease
VLRLDDRFRSALYAVVAILFVTGVAWLAVSRLQHEIATDRWSTAGASLLMVHGGAAMLMLVLFGALVPFHVRVAWRRRQNRTTGVVMLVSNALLIVTAFGLYYTSSETLRHWTSDLHTGFGLGLPALLAFHVWRGRRSRRGALRRHRRGSR